MIYSSGNFILFRSRPILCGSNPTQEKYKTTKHGHLQWDEPDGLRGFYCCLDHLMQNI